MLGKVTRATWKVWEYCFHLIFRLQALHPEENHLFFIAKRTYLGRQFTVNGEIVKPFDKVIELHMNNQLLFDMLRTDPQLVRIAVRLLREARKSMPVLAEVLRQTRFASIRVVYGVTFIHRGVTRFGFQIFPVRNQLSKQLTKWHLRHVLKMVNPDSVRILASHPDVFEPMLVAIAKEQLIDQYCLHPIEKGNAVARRDHCLT